MPTTQELLAQSGASTQQMLDQAGGAGTPATARHRYPQLEPASPFMTFDRQTILTQLNDPKQRKQFTSYEKEIDKTRQWLLSQGVNQDEIPQREDVHQPWYWWALDKLRTPQFVANAVIDQMLDGRFDPYLFTKAVGAAATGDLRIEGRDLIVKAFGEQMKEIFGDNAEPAASVLGLAWDIVADPLNFVGIGAVAKTRILTGGIKATWFGVGAATDIGETAQVIRRLGGIIVDEGGKARPLLESVGPALAAKTAKQEKVGMLGRLMGFGPKFTDDELKALEKFGAKYDPKTGLANPGPMLAALESKHGQKIMKAFEAGKLDSYIAAETLAEKVERGQWAWINVFGRSMLGPDLDRKIYQAGAALTNGAGNLALQVPGMAGLADMVAVAAQKGRAAFSTSVAATGIIGKTVERSAEEIKVAEKSLDEMFWAGGNLYQSVRTEYLHLMGKFSKDTRAVFKKYGREEGFKIVRDSMRVIEYPMLDNKRDALMRMPEAREALATALDKYGVTPFIDQLLKQGTGMGPEVAQGAGLTTALLRKAEFTAEDSNTVFTLIGQMVKKSREMGNVAGETVWAKVWDEAMSPFTPYGGKIFGTLGEKINATEKAAELFKSLKPEMQPIVTKFKETMKRLEQQDLDYNILHSVLDGYFPHQLPRTPEVVEALGMLPMPIGKRRGAGDWFAKHREQYLFFDDFLSEMEKTQGGGEVVAQYLIDAPALAVAIRGAGTHPKAVQTAFLHQEGAKRFGKTLAMARQEYAKAHNIPMARLKDIDDKMVDAWMTRSRGLRQLQETVQGNKFVGDAVYYEDDIAQVMERHFDLLQNPKKQDDLVSCLRYVNNLWKGWTLGVRPAFHVRNTISNVIQDFLAGMDTPAKMVGSYVLAGKFQVGISNSVRKTGNWSADLLEGAFWDRKIVTASGQVHTNRELANAMQKMSIYGSGIFAAESGAALMMGAKGTYNPLSVRNHFSRLGFRLGTIVENNPRSALFLYKVMEEGLDFGTAAQEVAKWHFDYADLTATEKSVRDLLVPFYAWSRKNLPLQISMTLTKPQQVTWIDKARSALEDDPNAPPIDWYGVQRWMRDSMPIRTAYNPETNEASYVMLRNYIPAADIQEAFDPFDFALQMVSPFIKLPMEVWGSDRGYSFFFRGDIERYKGQKRTLMGIEMGAKTQYALKTVGMVSQMDLFMPQKWKEGIHQAQTGKPMPIPYGAEPTETDKLVRGITGFKQYQSNPAEVIMWQEMEYRDQLRRFKSSYKKQAEREKEKSWLSGSEKK